MNETVPQSPSVSRRNFGKWGAYAVGSMLGLATEEAASLYSSIEYAQRHCVVTIQDISVPGLSPDIDGTAFVIYADSHYHIGGPGKGFINAVHAKDIVDFTVDTLEQLGTKEVIEVQLGDITSETFEINDLANLERAVTAYDGIPARKKIYLPGNHETPHLATYKKVLDVMDFYGYEILGDSTSHTSSQGNFITSYKSLPIIGLPDWGSDRSWYNPMPNDVLSALTSSSFAMTFAHNGSFMDKSSYEGEPYEDVLRNNAVNAAHTHWFMVNHDGVGIDEVSLLPYIARLAARHEVGYWSRFGAGSYDAGDNIVHVTRGLGTPMRQWYHKRSVTPGFEVQILHAAPVDSVLSVQESEKRIYEWSTIAG